MTDQHSSWWRRRTTLVAVLAAVVLLAATVVTVRLTRSPSGDAAGDGAGEALPSTAEVTVPAPSPGAGAATRPVTIAAAGDLVCEPGKVDEDGNGQEPRQCQHKQVADMLVARRPEAFLALGDTQYVEGTLKSFRTTYAPTYGRLFDVTYPVPGNHEYRTSGAAGYYGYFGARAGSPARGYYSFDLGGWHLVALNSNCEDVSCAAGSVQERWLRADLAAHPAACTLAYWHHPRWSHGDHGDDADVAPLVRALYDAKAEVVLNGHDHDYERYVPRDPDGRPDPNGLREFVVGTGGRNLVTAQRGEGTEAVDSDSFGALFLTLTPGGYSWNFTATNGSNFTDTGTSTCH